MYFFKGNGKTKAMPLAQIFVINVVYILNLLKYKTTVYVLTERRETDTSVFNEILNGWDHSLIRKNQHMRNKVHFYVIYILTIITGPPLTARKSYTRTTHSVPPPPTHHFFFIHSNLDITNKSVRPFLFTISNNSLYQV